MNHSPNWILFGLMSLATMTHSLVARAADALSPGFTVEPYADGLKEPCAIAFDPEGRLFIAEKSGAVRIALRGQIRDEPVVTLPVYDFFECGLIGMTLDPDYASKPYLYLFATMTAEEQRITRFRIVNGRAIEPTVIRDHIPSGGTIHNGGCLRFGPDGMLYFSVGDNGTSENAQNSNTLAGKVCRIMPDGTTPDDNPFQTSTGAASAVYAKGFRNPFRFCFSADGRLFLTDVGSFGDSRREELNLVHAAANYGWPEREGGYLDGDADGFSAPIYDYAEEGTCTAGIVSYSGTHFPAEYRGNLFQLDYTLSKVFRVTLEGDRVADHTLFVQGEGSTVDITQGPDGRLYYSELTTGKVARISFPANPTAEPGENLADDDWGGDDESTDNANDNCEAQDLDPDGNCADTQTGGGIAGGLFDALCGTGTASATLISVAACLCMGAIQTPKRKLPRP